MGTDVEASDGRIAAAERLILVMVPFSDFSCWWFPSRCACSSAGSAPVKGSFCAGKASQTNLPFTVTVREEGARVCVVR